MAKEISNFLISKLDNFKFTQGDDDSQSFLASRGIGKVAEIISILESYDHPITKAKLLEGLEINGVSGRSAINQVTGKYGLQNNVYTFGRSVYGLLRHLKFSDTEIDINNERVYYFMLQENIDIKWTCEAVLREAR